ncbi:hypothetical protein SKP52_02830 [Sphingopyxis fribergensis]|uniref:Large ribosomal subunit protein bL12 C-terminal domain-containing protein n=2 Tax=Sphingopyxis fribergensis TaxID=1515612 RepID=A0A0A7PBW7_9SPHN|nr:hypothetical protein SKP52_02830 [Sphingopyxis fribergensis]
MGKLLFLALGLLLGLFLAKYIRGRGRGDLTAPPPSRPMPRASAPPPIVRIGDERIDEEEIRELLRQDRKIEAIKRVRDRTGLGLAEAKDAVEAVEHKMR